MRGEVSTKSVRERTSLEQLQVIFEMLDTWIREVPSVAAATAARLGRAVEQVRFAYDGNAIEVPHTRSEVEFGLEQLVFSVDDSVGESMAMRALEALWSAVGKDVRIVKSEEGVWRPSMS